MKDLCFTDTHTCCSTRSSCICLLIFDGCDFDLRVVFSKLSVSVKEILVCDLDLKDSVLDLELFKCDLEMSVCDLEFVWLCSLLSSDSALSALSIKLPMNISNLSLATTSFSAAVFRNDFNDPSSL